MVCPLCGSSCDSSGCQIVKIFYHIPCIDLVFPLCGSSSDSSGCQILKIFDHIPCSDMVFSSVCILIWLFRLPEWENILLHSLQIYGLSSVWILMWHFRLPDWENILSHSLQGNGFFPCVDPHVTLKAARLRKSMVTFVACVWFLPGVQHFVLFHLWRRLKYLLTQNTLQLRHLQLWRQWTKDFHDSRSLCNWNNKN